LGIGAVGEAVLSRAFERWLATALAIVLAYLILTYVHVVIGELVPKGVALRYSERTALWVAIPVRAFFSVFAPFIWVLQRSSEAVLRAFELEHEEQQMIDKVFVFGDKDAADVMVPRPEVVAVSAELPTEQALAAVLE